jgi:hypothetical protein
MESQLQLPFGSAEQYIDKAADTLGHKVRRKGNNIVTFDKKPRPTAAEWAAHLRET